MSRGYYFSTTAVDSIWAARAVVIFEEHFYLDIYYFYCSAITRYLFRHWKGNYQQWQSSHHKRLTAGYISFRQKIESSDIFQLAKMLFNHNKIYVIGRKARSSSLMCVPQFLLLIGRKTGTSILLITFSSSSSLPKSKQPFVILTQSQQYLAFECPRRKYTFLI